LVESFERVRLLRGGNKANKSKNKCIKTGVQSIDQFLTVGGPDYEAKMQMLTIPIAPSVASPRSVTLQLDLAFVQ